MNEVLYGLGWILKGVEFSIVLFWLHKFHKMRWKLFFGVKKDLASVQHHELYSCFLTAFSVLIFHVLGSEIDVYLLSLKMEKGALIELFYTSKVITYFTFIMMLFCLHLIRGCTFSSTARFCTYVTIILMILQGVQLVARGYYDYHGLKTAYTIIGWLCSITVIYAIAVYPVRSIKDHYKERRATAS